MARLTKVLNTSATIKVPKRRTKRRSDVLRRELEPFAPFPSAHVGVKQHPKPASASKSLSDLDPLAEPVPLHRLLNRTRQYNLKRDRPVDVHFLIDMMLRKASCLKQYLDSLECTDVVDEAILSLCPCCKQYETAMKDLPAMLIVGNTTLTQGLMKLVRFRSILKQPCLVNAVELTTEDGLDLQEQEAQNKRRLDDVGLSTADRESDQSVKKLKLTDGSSFVLPTDVKLR